MKRPEEAASALTDEKIKGLGDWRVKALAKKVQVPFLCFRGMAFSRFSARPYVSRAILDARERRVSFPGERLSMKLVSY